MTETSEPNPGELAEFLSQHFHLQSFRTGQLEVILSALRRHDAIAVMPTGGGKSLCFQFPAVFSKGIVIVISPLIALMKDQVASLHALEIPAGAVHSGQDLSEKRRIFSDLQTSERYILYLSPERVQKPGFSDWIKKQRISLFAVDESHCISQWGPDFRPDYHRLEILRSLRPDVPIMALTASATPEVLRDIVSRLQLRKPDRHIHGFYRKNLFYQVEVCGDMAAKMTWLRQALLRTRRGRILIYCGTRIQCEDLTTELAPEFSEMGFYHAGMTAEERNRVQKDYEEGRIRILAATNAFGMGIDHPDVRLIVHFQMPARIESLYQEMGRAGRDGEDSTCLLLYAKKDKGLHSYFIRQSDGPKEIISHRWRALDVITQYAEGGECRHAGILTYFRDAYRLKSCGHCDVCAPDSPRLIPAPTLEREATPTRSRAKTRPIDAPLSPDAEVRSAVLKDWRKEYADEHDIPAFLVFSNRTLRDLAQRNPTTLEELEEVYGMGPHKLEHLGGLILEKLGECR